MKFIVRKTTSVLRSHAICRFLLPFIFVSITFPLISQYYILGRVLDDDEVPYANANAKLTGKDYQSEQVCTVKGVFKFENLKTGPYELILVTPYGIRRKKVELKGSVDI